MSELRPVGSRIHVGDDAYTVGAVGMLAGERYYWLVLDGDQHSTRMIPATTLETEDPR